MHKTVRSKLVGALLTPLEKQQVTKAAKKEGRSLSAFVRHKLVKGVSISATVVGLLALGQSFGLGLAP